MERLLSSYEYLLQACGTGGILLLAFLTALFFIQFWYWCVRYGRIPSYRGSSRGNPHPGVSVAMILHETDYGFIDDRLARFLGQEYDRFEIIVVDLCGDVEFSEALAAIAEHNPKLSVTRMARDPRFPISDKMAFNVAIKAAKYENIILSCVDCVPVSPQWIARMARGFDSAGIVIGYSGMEGGRSFSDRMIRMGCVGLSIRWLSAAMRGKPYRGAVQNLGFTKKLYFDNGGFNYLNMNIGEDDLFIQKLLKSSSAAVVVSSNSLIRRPIYGGLGWWYADRRMRSNAFRHYPARVRRYIATELWSRFLFFAAVAATVIILPMELKLFAIALLTLRLGIVVFEMRRITRRLSERGLLRTLPLYDMGAPFYEAWMALDRKFRRSPGLWR